MSGVTWTGTFVASDDFDGTGSVTVRRRLRGPCRQRWRYGRDG